MRVRVAGGTLVDPGGLVRMDLLIDDGTVIAWFEPERRVEVDAIVDASGEFVFPGFIDPHVHSRDPGLTENEDFAHLTRGAAAGGITTVFEMPNAIPPLSTAEIFRERWAYHERSAYVDFGLWGISLGSENLKDISALIAEGVVGIKLFWGYALDRRTKQLVYDVSGRSADDLLLPPANDEVLELFQVVADAGGLLAAHCEDRGVIDYAARSARPTASPYEDLLAARPDTAESAAIALGIEFAQATGCRFHVVHVSSKRGLDLIREAQQRGIDVSAETCPHYLTLTDASYGRVGSAMKVFPPVRRDHDRDALWTGIAARVITSIGSDHAPHKPSERNQPFAAQPAGAPGVETMARVILNEAHEGRLGYERVAAVLSEGTAKRYGVYPAKGSLRPGSDADLTFVDPSATWTIRNEDLHTKSPVSPWHGVSGTGLPTRTIVRGETVMERGELTGVQTGKLVRREIQPTIRTLVGGVEGVVS